MKIRFFMVLVTACASFSFMYAQTLAKPAEPNEICMEAWNNYRKADALWKTGWGLFGAGAGMTVAGCVAWTCTSTEWNMSHDNMWATNPGFSIMCIGGGVFTASIPCLAIGQVRRKAAMKIYDELDCSPETCAEIKLDYKKADNLWKTGWGLFGAGQALAIGGGLLYAFTMNWGLPPESVPAWQSAACTSGFTVMIIGGGMTVASIPCLSVGQVRRKAAQSAYNKKGTSDSPLTFTLQSSANGIGIAMNF